MVSLNFGDICRVEYLKKGHGLDIQEHVLRTQKKINEMNREERIKYHILAQNDRVVWWNCNNLHRLQMHEDGDLEFYSTPFEAYRCGRSEAHSTIQCILL